MRDGVGVALLLVGIAVVFLWEPWHGPTLLTLTSGHGFDAGDLPALPLLVLAAAILRAHARSSPRETWPWRPRRSAAAASAILLGAVLLVEGAVARPSAPAPLVPAGGGTFGGRTAFISGVEASPPQRWTHLAVTYDGATLRLYVNGTIASQEAVTGALRTTADPLWVGGNQPYGEFFAGLVDEVRVYDRALLPRDVRFEMSAPIGRRAADAPGLVAAYGFENGSRLRATDASGNHNDGVVLGATRETNGRFGGALRFDGVDDLVRVAAARSLDLVDAMTLSAWVRPERTQAGWRTVMSRETDAYFLMAGGGDASTQSEVLGEDAAVALTVGALTWFCFCLTSLQGVAPGISGRRRSWWPPVVLVIAGLTLDAVLAPTGALVGPTLAAAWFASTASSRVEAAVLGVLTALFAGATVVSLLGRGGEELARDEGGIARSIAFGLLLVVIGIFAARNEHVRPDRTTSSAPVV